MVVAKVGRAWGYDFRLLGRRHRKARFKTKAEATKAEERRRAEVVDGKRKMLFSEVFEKYMSGSQLAVTTREDYTKYWEKDIREHVAGLFVEEVLTDVMDTIKGAMPKKRGPKTINQRLILLRAVLRFAWKRGWLAAVPYVPMEKVPDAHHDWYTVEERDIFLAGVLESYPQWYAFFYITARLGLRRGEIYPMEHPQFQRARGEVLIDKAAAMGNKDRPPIIKRPKNNKIEVLQVSDDVFDVYDWHCEQGYAGKKLVFCASDEMPRYLDTHEYALARVQKATGLRKVGHHTVGRHSVASQAVASGHHLKAVQRQLRHKNIASTNRYAHVADKQQRAIVDGLRPPTALPRPAVATDEPEAVDPTD